MLDIPQRHRRLLYLRLREKIRHRCLSAIGRGNRSYSRVTRGLGHSEALTSPGTRQGHGDAPRDRLPDVEWYEYLIWIRCNFFETLSVRSRRPERAQCHGENSRHRLSPTGPEQDPGWRNLKRVRIEHLRRCYATRTTKSTRILFHPVSKRTSRRIYRDFQTVDWIPTVDYRI